jgi:hypothetical protein
VYRVLLSSGVSLAVSLAVLLTPSYALAADRDEGKVSQIAIRDDCDPATFNLPPPNGAGPGTCNPLFHGETTFARFLDVLGKLHSEPKWRFSPDTLEMRVGDSFVATDRGGELHSFTEVAKFGGGVVPFLNDLSQRGATVPECSEQFGLFLAGQPSSFVLPGQSFTDTEGTNDVGHPVLYQCCIHPWMNEVITVRPADKH